VDTYALTIAGNTREFQEGSLRLRMVARGQWTLGMTFLSTDGSVLPNAGQEVTLSRNGTPAFAGYIDQPERALRPNGHALPGVVTVINASDYNQILKEVSITSDRPEETLVDRLTYFATLLPAGFTLDGAQVTGPTLPAQKYQEAELFGVIRELEERLNGWVGELGIDKKLRLYDPASNPAPFNITSSSKLVDIRVSPSSINYGNRVILSIGKPEQRDVADDFGPGDGVTAAFRLNYPLVTPYGYLTVNGVYETLQYSTDPPGSGTWSLDLSANTVTRSSAPAMSATIVMTYVAQFPVAIMVEDLVEQASYGRVVTKRFRNPDLFDVVAGTAQANGILARIMVQPKSANYEIQATTLPIPGQAQNVDLAQFGMANTDCVITDVELVGNPRKMRVRVVAVEGGFVRAWRDVIHDWLGGDITGASTTASASSAGGAPFGPLHSVQVHNPQGRFFGSSAFIMNDAHTSVMLGTDLEADGDYNLLVGEGHRVS
jgi:hypothetical protein